MSQPENTTKHPAMFMVATLDVAPYDGPNHTCANCDEESEDLLIFEVSGTNKSETKFVICAECIGEMLETASGGEADSGNVNVQA